MRALLDTACPLTVLSGLDAVTERLRSLKMLSEVTSYSREIKLQFKLTTGQGLGDLQTFQSEPLKGCLPRSKSQLEMELI